MTLKMGSWLLTELCCRGHTSSWSRWMPSSFAGIRVTKLASAPVGVMLSLSLSIGLTTLLIVTPIGNTKYSKSSSDHCMGPLPTSLMVGHKLVAPEGGLFSLRQTSYGLILEGLLMAGKDVAPHHQPWLSLTPILVTGKDPPAISAPVECSSYRKQWEDCWLHIEINY